jgi:hypothetical protein
MMVKGEDLPRRALDDSFFCTISWPIDLLRPDLVAAMTGLT